jgi:hemolysin type calcium-binding protein
MAQITVTPVNHFAGTQRHDRLLGGPGTDELVGSIGDDLLLRGSGNDTLADGPGDDRSRGDEAVTTYLDEEPVAEPTTWALWAGLFGIGISLLPMLLLALWYTVFPLRRNNGAVTGP